MKRFVSFLALTLMWPILRAPAWAQLTTLGVGGIAAVVIGTLITPSIVPQPSSYFNQNGPNGFTNNGLQTNGGAVGAMQYPPTTPNNSIVVYVEGQIDPSLTYYQNTENAFASATNGTRFGVSSLGIGNPQFLIQSNVSNAASTQWWNALATDTGSLNPLVPVRRIWVFDRSLSVHDDQQRMRSRSDRRMGRVAAAQPWLILAFSALAQLRPSPHCRFRTAARGRALASRPR